jgi:hypothetical protein
MQQQFQNFVQNMQTLAQHTQVLNQFNQHSDDIIDIIDFVLQQMLDQILKKYLHGSSILIFIQLSSFHH